MNKTLDTVDWMPIKINNVTEAYGTTVNISIGLAKLVHTNQAALMSVMIYGFTSYGGYGTIATFTNKSTLLLIYIYIYIYI